MPTPREVLTLLSRADLLRLADHFGIELPERRSKQPIVSALAASSGVEPDQMLLALSRDHLKELCRKLGLDTGGRDKAGFVKRLLSGSTMNNEAKTSSLEQLRTRYSVAPEDSPRREDRIEAQILQQILGARAFLGSTAVEPLQQLTVVASLLLLKRLNDLYDERAAELIEEGAPPAVATEAPVEHDFFVPPAARWPRLVDSHAPDRDLNRACLALERANDRLKGVLTSVDFTNKRLFGIQSYRHALLRNLIHLLSKLSLRDSDMAEPSSLGRAYSSILEQIASWVGKAGEGSFTPSTLARLVVEIVAPEEGMRICDPVCGTGSLLIGCADYVQEHGGETKNLQLSGQEAHPSICALARINMLLHGLRDARIEAGDTILQPRLVTDGKLDLYDRVIANPPFSIRWWGHEVAGG